MVGHGKISDGNLKFLFSALPFIRPFKYFYRSPCLSTRRKRDERPCKYGKRVPCTYIYLSFFSFFLCGSCKSKQETNHWSWFMKVVLSGLKVISSFFVRLVSWLRSFNHAWEKFLNNFWSLGEIRGLYEYRVKYLFIVAYVFVELYSGWRAWLVKIHDTGTVDAMFFSTWIIAAMLIFHCLWKVSQNIRVF